MRYLNTIWVHIILKLTQLKSAYIQFIIIFSHKNISLFYLLMNKHIK